MRLAAVHTLHQGDFCRILDFRCHCVECNVSETEYSNTFYFSFIRKGFFEYRTFKRKEEIHVGRVLLSKPGYERVVRHIENQPDIVTIFEFKPSFFTDCLVDVYGKKLSWFLLNKDIHSLMLNATPELEYIHHRLYQIIASRIYNSLEADEMVLLLLEKIMMVLGNYTSPEIVDDKLKQHHLVTIESAREYLLKHFNENISLQQLAAHCFVSPFHFSRIFKTTAGESPHQYLTKVRLTHAKVLLTETNLPVSDVAFECGFNSPEHFVTAFKQHYAVNPSSLRKELI
ncbi:MAG: helix-turn-helix transcriptional regulator [Sphingobacteriales bacterium]|nr:helix-turn-helix transcriptional regulator [Sphingobacteriales bacterium]